MLTANWTRHFMYAAAATQAAGVKTQSLAGRGPTSSSSGSSKGSSGGKKGSRGLRGEGGT